MSVTFSGPGGVDPAADMERKVDSVQITVAEMRTVSETARTDILERTINGIDSEGNSFEPYSTNGPYHVYPKSGGTPKQRKSAVNRLLKITTGVANARSEFFGSASIGGAKVASGLGVRFESYADYKRSLGFENPNLMVNGRMLRSMQSRPTDLGFEVGFWEADQAIIAEAHNDGTSRAGRGNKVRIPRRHFLDFNERELTKYEDMLGRIVEGKLKLDEG